MFSHAGFRATTLVIATSISFVGCDSFKKTPKTDSDKTLVTMGKMFSAQTQHLNLTADEKSFIMQGFQNPGDEVMTPEQQMAVQKWVKDRMDARVKAETESGTKYLEDFVQKGGQKTQSGLAYKIITPGAEIHPTAESTVEVDYEGSFTNGKVFDSSYNRKQTLTIPLNGVIPGWREGMQLVGEGGEIELVVPADLGYGERGSPPTIPGGSTLHFKIKLVKILAAEQPAQPEVSSEEPEAPAPTGKSGKKK